jgi:hypothetical protein
MKLAELFETSVRKDYFIDLWLSYNALTTTLIKLNENPKKITNAIDKKTGLSSIIQVGKGTFEISLEVPEHQVNDFANYIDDVNAVLKEFFDITEIREDSGSHIVHLTFAKQVPSLPIPIEFPNIFIQNLNKTSLSGIHKIIKDFNYLEINNPENITGGVLGLIKLAKHGVIKINTPNPEWANIISKHYKTGNILAAQEDLIDNGFKDYAEL